MATIKDIIVRVRADVSQLQSGLATSASSVTKFSSSMSRAGSTLTRRVSFPLVAAGGAAVKMAYDFEESFVRIGALVGASQKDIEGYQKAVLALSAETATAPKDLADALYFVTSSGFEGASALKVLDASARAAAAGLGDTVTVADAVTSAVNAYGEKTLSAASATDVLVGAVREGKGEASELAGVIGRVIPLAAELDVSFQDVGGAMSAMTLSGLDAAEATTALRGIFTTLLKPTEDGEKALKAMGISTEELRKNMAEHGLIETLLDLKDRLGDNKEAMAAIFPNVRALAGFLNLTGANAEKNVGIFNSLRNSVDATGKAFDKTARSDGFKFRKALTELRVEAIKIGQELIPIIVDDVIPAFRAALRWWKSLSDESKGLALKLAGLAILAGPLLRFAGAIGKVVGALMRWGKVPPIPAGGGIPGGVLGGRGGVPPRPDVPPVAAPGTGLRGPLVVGPQPIIPLETLEQAEAGLRSVRSGAVDLSAALAVLQRHTDFNQAAFLAALDAGSSYAEALRGGSEATKGWSRNLEKTANTIRTMRGPLSQVEVDTVNWLRAQGKTGAATEYLNGVLARAKSWIRGTTDAVKTADKAHGYLGPSIRGVGNEARTAHRQKITPYGRALGSLPKRAHTSIALPGVENAIAQSRTLALLLQYIAEHGATTGGGGIGGTRGHRGSAFTNGGGGGGVKVNVNIGRERFLRQVAYQRDYGGAN